MADYKDFEKLLTDARLKKTRARLKILALLSESSTALSQPVLEKHMSEDADRVTLYRVLAAFEEKGLIHKIIDNEGTANYAMLTGGPDNRFKVNHLHFNCNVCNKIYCLPEQTIPQFNYSLPAGFALTESKLVLHGKCAACNV